MKKLLLNSAVFILLVSISSWLLLDMASRGFSDRYYYKFTRKAPSLILGSSRALLGLDPDKIKERYPAADGLLNFAFTLKTSPYGETYYNAIAKKVADGNDGVFIIEVSPLSISEPKEGKFAEEALVLNHLLFFNANPNYEYILRHSETPLYQSVFKIPAKRSIQEPHYSGWLENLTTRDSTSRKKKIAEQDKEYRTLFRNHRLSQTRLSWLQKTIELLSQHGRVILVRMPVSERMHELERGYMPEFGTILSGLAGTYHVEYTDFTMKPGFAFDDLHHLTSVSAREISTELGELLAARNPAKRVSVLPKCVYSGIAIRDKKLLYE
jgi:hypothetical protein